VRLKTVEHGANCAFSRNQSPEFRVVICLAIEPSINESPGTWRRIQQRQIASAHQFVDRPVGFGKQIPQFHCSLIQSDTSQPVAGLLLRRCLWGPSPKPAVRINILFFIGRQATRTTMENTRRAYSIADAFGL